MGVGAAFKFGAKVLGKAALNKMAENALTKKEEVIPEVKEEEEKKEFVSKTLQQIFDDLKNTSSFDTVEVNEGWHDDYNPETTEDAELNEKEKEEEEKEEKD